MTAHRANWRTIAASQRRGEHVIARTATTTAEGRRLEEELTAEAFLVQTDPTTGATRVVLGFRRGTDIIAADELTGVTRITTYEQASFEAQADINR
ncbi:MULTISPECIES: hypothetical protein [Gordonia]|uniref:Uncharacterized protein n=1 Tax=Gordonia amicalis TaxID=89053 RepID=A0AAE4U956_9ACTN|nr:MULTISPECIES: hypothetical protein [Gordonia]ATD69185.1 hypothetical protein CNO18_01560 [Gordonia sp. 1D]MCZ4654230.1 hypothetical protein [Gordonia amicalis]MDJ0452115.1 hypothetical protein [Gordonia amicalis]MDV6308186.1 hypothetical protein [Gordonia amicalis]MDV6312003.1 hypothetical protein [Gordonia amicalis]